MTLSPAAPRTATYHRYLDAAEQAFIHYGYEGASIRRISQDAGAPLGTLHHYWGTKEALFADVCERRFRPIQARQLQALRALAASGATPELEQVIRAMIEAPLLAEAGDPARRDTVRRLYGRVLTEPSDVVKRIVVEVFREDTLLFRDLLRAACASLDPEAFYWRMTCALGAFIFAQSFGDRVAYAIPGSLKEQDVDWRRVVDEITGFIVRGMG
jgi:AcrR family transcriptional regulator